MESLKRDQEMTTTVPKVFLFVFRITKSQSLFPLSDNFIFYIVKTWDLRPKGRDDCKDKQQRRGSVKAIVTG